MLMHVENVHGLWWINNSMVEYIIELSAHWAIMNWQCKSHCRIGKGL